MGVVTVDAFHMPGSGPDVLRGIMNSTVTPYIVPADLGEVGLEICRHIAVVTHKTNLLFPVVGEQTLFAPSTMTAVAIET